MYSANYGFPNAAGPTFNSAPQNPHLQPGHVPNPNAPQQQMMYNPQQFPMGTQGGGFPGGPGNVMMPGAGGMMQNPGMPQMAAANGQMANFATPYSNGPYGASIPSSVAPQMNMPPNYAMVGGMPMPAGYPMHPGQMTPQQQQQMMQRMQPSPANAGMSVSTPQRQFPSQAHGQTSRGTPTPNHVPQPQQAQFSAPQVSQNVPQNQASGNTHQQAQQTPGSNIQTPQTPTFPSNPHSSSANGVSSTTTPISPGGDQREKERLVVLLEINNELLAEAIQLQHTQGALRKEHAAARDGATNGSDPKHKEEEELIGKDYVQVMRRLQTNLAYLASLADKKGSVQPAPCPAILKAPPLNTKVKLRPMPAQDGTESKSEAIDRDETAKYLQDLYTKLQGLYPGIDPNKEPAYPLTRHGPHGSITQNAGGTRTPSQASPVSSNTRTPRMSNSGPPQTQPLQPTANVSSAS